MNINLWLSKNKRSCKYGAPMGAADWKGDPDYAYKFYIQKLIMTDGCYTLDGTYWGGPADLYCAMCPEHEVRMFIRAKSREDAKAKVREEYPNARFFK